MQSIVAMFQQRNEETQTLNVLNGVWREDSER